MLALHNEHVARKYICILYILPSLITESLLCWVSMKAGDVEPVRQAGNEEGRARAVIF